MPTLAALLFCTLLAALAVFQLSLALGAPLGRFAWGGQHEVLPRRLRLRAREPLRALSAGRGAYAPLRRWRA